MSIEFGKLYFAATFIDPNTNLRFVKIDESHAVQEDDPSDLPASFDAEELVLV